jgi:hypothetical protein
LRTRRFKTLEGDEKKKMPVALKLAVETTVGIRNMFEEVFVEMEEQLPAQTKLSIGPNPLVCITPVFEVLTRNNGNEWHQHCSKALELLQRPARRRAVVPRLSEEAEVLPLRPGDFETVSTVKKGGFIDPQNYRRKMRNLAEECGLPKLTFQVIRPGDDHRRLHAGDSGKREGDGGSDQQHVVSVF